MEGRVSVYYSPMTKYFLIFCAFLTVAALVTQGGFALLQSLV